MNTVWLLNTAEPDRSDGSMVRYAAMIKTALEQQAPGEWFVSEFHLAPRRVVLNRFPAAWRTPFRYLWIAAASRRVLRRSPPAILHLLDGSHAYLLPARRPIAAPLVITVHDLIPLLTLRGELAGHQPSRWGGRLIRRAAAGLGRADLLAAVSENTRRDLLRLLSIPADRVHVVPHAIGIPPVNAAQAPVPATPPYLLHVAGNNTFYKNRPGVVDIFDRIRSGGDSVRLVLAGAPPDENLRRRVAASPWAADIEFRPHVSEEELAGLYRNATLLLFPSRYEGFGWPPLEAMQQGCPVVCSNAGALPEIVGEAALTAAPDDVAALAALATEVLRQHELRERLVAAGLRRAREFSFSALALRLQEAYQKAMLLFAQRSPP